MNASDTGAFPGKMDVGKTWRPLRIAVVYSRIPIPMRRADQKTVAHLLSFLAERGHVVDLYCLDAGGAADAVALQWLGETCARVRVYKHGWWSALRGLFRAVVGRLPIQVGLFTNMVQRADLRREIERSSYDIVYTYYFRSAEITRGLGRATRVVLGSDTRPVSILAMQLSQALNTRRISMNAPGAFVRWFYTAEKLLAARYEARIWRDFTYTILIGSRDVEEIRRCCRERGLAEIDNVLLCAHGTDLSRFCPHPDRLERRHHIVFCGVMRTPTNIHATLWFAEKVWPRVRKLIPDATWTIVGREPSKKVVALGRLPGVRVTGTVTDPSQVIAEASVCIDPMLAGGGMQNKLIEYLSCGKAVVATSVANEGVAAIPGEHLLIADSPEEFANAVVRLLSDTEMRRVLGKAGRDFALDNWTWRAHFLKLEGIFYQSLDVDTGSLSSGAAMRQEAEEETPMGGRE